MKSPYAGGRNPNHKEVEAYFDYLLKQAQESLTYAEASSVPVLQGRAQLCKIILQDLRK